MTPNLTKGLAALPGHNVVPFDQGAGRKIDGVGCNRLGPREIDALCFHRSQGGGSVNWLLNPNVAGLTDWVINPRSGLMTQINFLTGTNRDVSGWAQGPINIGVASADVKKFLAEHGGNYNAWNQHVESIEVEDFYDDPIGDQCRKDLSQWAASRAHDDGIVWDRFPIRSAAKGGNTFIFGHREACGVAYKACPGSVLWAFINGELIDRVQVILKAAQIGTKPAQPAGPVYRRAPMPPAMKLDPMPETMSLNSKTFDLDNKEYRVEKLTGCFSGIKSATRSRSSLRPGDVVRIVYLARDKRWGIAAGGSRIEMKHLSEIVDVDQAA